MPLYEYQCSSCKKSFEMMQAMSARPPRKCPECGASGTVVKQVAAPAFQFKGSGWYVTDYARQGDKETKGTKEAKEAKETKESSTSQDDTTASKASKAPDKDAKETKAEKPDSGSAKTPKGD